MASSFPKLPGFVPTQNIDVIFTLLPFLPIFSDHSPDQQFQKNKCCQARCQPRYRKHLLKLIILSIFQKNVPVSLLALPRKQELHEPDQTRALHPDYLTTTQETYVPHVGDDSMKLYQPTWVHLDRQVNFLKFIGIKFLKGIEILWVF